MPKYYVQFVDGRVISLPKELSSSPYDSPNNGWGLDQMKKNNFMPCEILYDPITQKPDYEDPIITSSMVSYQGIGLSDEKIKENQNALADRNRQAEYPTINDKVDAMWAYLSSNDQVKLNVVINKIELIDKKYPKV